MERCFSCFYEGPKREVEMLKEYDGVEKRRVLSIHDVSRYRLQRRLGGVGKFES